MSAHRRRHSRDYITCKSQQVGEIRPVSSSKVLKSFQHGTNKTCLSFNWTLGNNCFACASAGRPDWRATDITSPIRAQSKANVRVLRQGRLMFKRCGSKGAVRMLLLLEEQQQQPSATTNQPPLSLPGIPSFLLFRRAVHPVHALIIFWCSGILEKIHRENSSQGRNLEKIIRLAWICGTSI